MQRRLCYISRCYRNAESAGSKAKSDYETVLRSMGAVNLGLPISFHNNKVVAFLLNLIGIGLLVLRLRKGDILFLQYPVKKYFVFLCRFARFRKASSIVFIHDLGSPLIEEEGIGILIDSLQELDHILKDMTSERYEKMIENISRVNAQISNGQCLKNALLKAVESFNQSEKTVH